MRRAATAARELRDATSMLECFDALAGRYAERLDPSEGEPVRRALAERREELESALDVDTRLEGFRDAMKAADGRVDAWSFDDDEAGFAAVRGGLIRTARRAARALEAAREEPTAEKLHEWRKRVKYHRYHTRLLREVWPPVMEARLDAVHRLSDLLGDDHDLVVLRRTLLDEEDRFGSASRLTSLLGRIDVRRAELQAWSLPLAARLHADPKRPAERWVARVERWWRAWEQERRLARILPESSGPTGS